jgi:hypothetical protein
VRVLERVRQLPLLLPKLNALVRLLQHFVWPFGPLRREVQQPPFKL